MLQTGLGARGFIGGYTAGASNGTATWPSAQGPQTATQAGWGTTAVAGAGKPHRVAAGVLSLGSLSLVALIWIWWSLPR